MNKKRRRFSTKFKAMVALEAAKEIKTDREISRHYELSEFQVVKWKIQLLMVCLSYLSDVVKRKRKRMIGSNSLLNYIKKWVA